MQYFLTIAASDNSGGAGIQQDIKVALDLGYWPLSAITGITVQDFNKVFEIQPVNSDLLKSQIEQCFRSFPVDVVKIGTICCRENINVIVDILRQFPNKHIVLDPVIFSSSGAEFTGPSSLNVLKEKMFPLTELITPNKPEFELLAGCCIDSIDEGIEIATDKSKEWDTSILLKGGHFNEPIIKEALITKTKIFRFERERNIFLYSHGTGCTLSSALACYLGKNIPINEAYILASEYLVRFYDDMQKRY